MDYGRLFLFMAAATAVMATGTHLWCWAYMVASRIAFYWRMEQFRKQLEIDNLEEDEIERRRAAAPRYQTYEQFQADVRDMAIPLDDILDRLNGKFPPKAADIQKAGPAAPPSPSESIQSAISGPVLATTLVTLALLTLFWGLDPSAKAIEELLKWARQKHGALPPTPGAGA